MTAGSHARAKGLALALLAATQFVIVLDASIVNVALPSIGRALDFSQDDLSWVVNAYTLTFGGFLLLGGPPRRPPRPPARVHRRPRAVLYCLARRRSRAVRRVAHHRPRDPGPRRGDHLPRRAVARHDDVRRGLRAQPRAGRLGRRRRLRRRGRRAARRRADPVRGLGVGAVRQRADRHRRGVHRPAPAAREPRHRERPRLRRRRRHHGHRRPRAARLHAGRRQQRRLDLHADARARRDLTRAPGGVRRDREPDEQPAHAAADLPPSHPSGRGRRRPADRHVAVRDVLLPVALHAAGARLRRAEDRASPTCRSR